MAAQMSMSARKPSGNSMRYALLAIGAIALVVAMAMDTKVVELGSDEDVRADVFSPQAFGESEFPNIQAAILQRAPDAQVLIAALEQNKDAAVEQFGNPGSIGPFMSVKITGVVGEGKLGVYDLAVEGMPEELRIRVQTGPAINGTELRDATGTISFGQFTNQIEYQNAGSAINTAMKEQVLASVDTSELQGKTITVVGVFTLINPKSWLVTPVKLDVQ